MSGNKESKPPVWFVLVALVALVWNVAGVAAFIHQVTMDAETYAQLPMEQQSLIANTPMWANVAFAIAVFGGALGSLMLVLRNSLSVVLFELSLAGVMIQMFHTFFMTRSVELFGPGGLVMPLSVIAVAIYLVLLAFQARARGWTT